MCEVCVKPFTEDKRKPIACPTCRKEACLSCYQAYLLSSALPPHCMFCRHQWAMPWLRQVFPPSWVNKAYRAHQEGLLKEAEKALFPEAMEYIQQAKAIQELTGQKTALLTQVAAIEQQIEVHRTSARSLERPDERRRPRSRIMFRCSACTGYVSSVLHYQCTVCHGKYCAHCQKPLGEGHVCCPADVDTVAMLARDCKPCPSCLVSTHRIDGCSQMWCTLCNTAWSWTTGQRIEGPIHNPHYFQYLRDGGRVAERAERTERTERCRPILSLFQARYRETRLPYWDMLMILYRHNLHNTDVELTRLAQVHRDDFVKKLAWRVQFLQGQLTEAAWQQHLQRLVKHHEYHSQLHGIVEMMTQVLSDILARAVQAPAPASDMMERPIPQPDRSELEQEIVALFAYVNTQFAHVADLYGRKPWTVAPAGALHRI